MTDSMDAVQPQRALTLQELVRRLVERWVLITSVVVAVVGGVALWSFLAVPRYRSTAVVRIVEQRQDLQLGDQVSALPGAALLGLDRDNVDTEVGVIRSYRIAASIVDSLGLTVVVSRPKGIRSHTLDVLSIGDTDREAKLVLRRDGSGSYAAEAEEPDQPTVDLGVVRPGQPFEHAGYRLAVHPLPADSLPRTIRIDIVPRFEAIDDLRDELVIQRQLAGARLVEVSYVSYDRELGAAVVNAVVDEYVAYKTTTEHSESRYTVAELRGQLAAQADSLAIAEERLRRYQEANRIVAPEEEATQQVRRLAQLQVASDELQVEREALADLIDMVSGRIEDPTRRIGPSEYRQLATFPSLISNQAIQDVLTALLELENDRSELLVLRTEENRDVRALTDRIAEIERQLFDLSSDYLESLDNQLSSVRSGLSRLESEIETLPGREMEYLRRLRDREVLEEGYVLLQQQLRLAEVEDAIRAEGVRVVDSGQIAHEDDVAYPKPLVNVFLALVLGGALGLGAALTLDLLEA